MQPLPDGDLRQLGEARELGLDTWVRKRAGMFCRIHTQAEAIRIEFPGGSISGSKPIERALRYVASTEEFEVRELPGGLSERAKLILAWRLIAEGLLRQR